MGIWPKWRGLECFYSSWKLSPISLNMMAKSMPLIMVGTAVLIGHSFEKPTFPAFCALIRHFLNFLWHFTWVIPVKTMFSQFKEAEERSEKVIENVKENPKNISFQCGMSMFTCSKISFSFLNFFYDIWNFLLLSFHIILLWCYTSLNVHVYL